MRAGNVAMFATATMVYGLTALSGQAPAPPPATASVPQAPFTAHTVATGIRGAYQVVATDMNRDGRVDLIALSSQVSDLVWFENPTWTRHVITRDAPRMINLAAADADGDGIPELGLAYEFSTNPAQSAGKIAILKAGTDPRELWTLREIDAIPTSHRVRFATIDGTAILINAPILGAMAKGGFSDPDHTPTPLRAYRPPDWKPETITEANQGVVHGLFTGDWDGDGRDDVVTAGYSGIFAHSLGKDGTWTRRELAKGDPAPWPQGGASDVAAGTIGGRRMLVTNEPFHGNQVVVYQQAADGSWPRSVIDTQLVNSHSLTLVDGDGDGTHEIVSGGTRGAPGSGRGVKPGVFYYRPAGPAGQTWERMMLDPGIAANSCVTADINGDRRMDVACIDLSDPWSIKWYEYTKP